MVTLPPEHLDEIFIYKVDRLRELGTKEPRTNPIRVDMAGCLRPLVHDNLAERVAQRYTTPLLVLRPEPESGNPKSGHGIDIPENVMRYAQPITKETHPPGFFHCPYTLDEFLDVPLGVLASQPITARECIRLLSDKLGAIHMATELVDGTGRKPIRAKTLYQINEGFIIFGTPGVFKLFDGAAAMIWRCLAPLRDEIASAYQQEPE